MAKIGTIGGANPKPETFGRRHWLGPLRWSFLGDNKQWSGAHGDRQGETIPLNPVYGLGIPTSVYWAEHGSSYYNITGDGVFYQSGVKLEMRDAAKNASHDAVFVGISPKNWNFAENPIAPMFPGNGTPGITAISFDWERDDPRDNTDKHRMYLYKVALIERLSDLTWRFRELSYKGSHSPAASGGLNIFRYRNAGEQAFQTGTAYCPIRMDHYTNPPTAIQNNGLHNVVGIAIQFSKESGGNAASKSGAYIIVKNLRFHTKGNKEIIIPRQKIHPKFNQYPNGNYEFYTW